MFKFLKALFLPAPQVITKERIVKDPHGLIKRDIEVLRKYAGRGKYSVGDSLESVAYRQGQLDLIEMIEAKMVAKPKPLN